MNSKPKLVFAVNVDWFFLSHRLPLAMAAKQAGLEVYVLAEDTGKGEVIEQYGLKFIPFGFSTGNHMLQDLQLLSELTRLYKKIRPVLVHQVTIKPVLIGSLAARLANVPAMVNALSGLGYLYINQSVKVRLARILSSVAFKVGFRHSHSRLILQNNDDKKLVLSNRLVDERKISIIRGSGVDENRFAYQPESGTDVRVVLPGRMLWDKGVGEFVEAAAFLKTKFPHVSFHLVGEPYPDNPKSIPLEQLQRWNREGHVQYEGHQEDMVRVLKEASIVCLPSYREGLPKALLEASAIGRPIVTTDAPGCREIVRDGVNGYLVPVRDSYWLSKRIEKLILEPDTRRRFGENGRQIVENEFTVEKIATETLTLYRTLLGNRWPQQQFISKEIS